MVKKTLTCCWPSGLQPYCQLHERKSFLNRSPGRDFGAELGTKAEWGLGEEITTRAEPNAAGLHRLTLVPFPEPQKTAPLNLMGEAICVWKMLCTLGIACVSEVH